MRIPSRNAGTYKICEAFYHHKKPVTLGEGIALHGYTGLPKRHVMQSLYTNMCDAGYITEVDGVFSLSPHMVRYFDGCEQKVEAAKRRTYCRVMFVPSDQCQCSPVTPGCHQPHIARAEFLKKRKLME